MAPFSHNSAKIISLPRGVSDYLADTTESINMIESTLNSVFKLWGYRQIITPNLEYEAVMSLGLGEQLKNKSYRFEDRQSGKMLAFPSDITPQIARIAATRLKDRPLPHRISYSGRVLRQTEMQAGRSREIFQSGVELIGLESTEADAEMIAMTVEALHKLGFKSFKIDMGQVEFCRGVLAASGITGQALIDLQRALSLKETAAVEDILRGSAADSTAKNEIVALTRLFGGREVMEEARRTVINPRSVRALNNLQQVLDILDIHGVSSYLSIDLGETRGLDYHTGTTFEAFVSGLGEPVCSGGRYDSLISAYGFDVPATGFTFNVLNLLQAVDSEPASTNDGTQGVLLSDHCGDRGRVLEIASALRRNGVVIARDIIKRSYELSLEYARKNRFGYMLVIDNDGCHAVRLTDGKRIELHEELLKNGGLLEYLAAA